jgi:hypothetical protein
MVRIVDRLVDRYLLWVIRRAGRRFARRIRRAQGIQFDGTRFQTTQKT